MGIRTPRVAGPCGGGAALVAGDRRRRWRERERFAAAVTKACLVPGMGKPLDQVWQPDMSRRSGTDDTRTGDIAFAVRTDQRFYGYRPDHGSGRRASSRRC